MNKLPEHGLCFVCGQQNPKGMGAVWYVLEDHSIFSEICLTDAQQGPPQMAHGGASAALLDEAMGAAVWQAGYRAAAVELNVKYHCPVPLGAIIQIKGWVMDSKEKVVFTRGEIQLPDSTIAVTAVGTYVQAPQLFENLGKRGEAKGN